MPINPIRPEPKSHTAAGIGTAGVAVTNPDPVSNIGREAGNGYSNVSSTEVPIVPPASVKAVSKLKLKMAGPSK